MASSSWAARTDDEEAQALALAIALSLNDDVPASAIANISKPGAQPSTQQPSSRPSHQQQPAQAQQQQQQQQQRGARSPAYAPPAIYPTVPPYTAANTPVSNSFRPPSSSAATPGGYAGPSPPRRAPSPVHTLQQPPPHKQPPSAAPSSSSNSSSFPRPSQQQPTLPPPIQPAAASSKPPGSSTSNSSSKQGTVGALGSKVGSFFNELLPSCAGCGSKLGISPHVNALGASWHMDCFRCGGCGRPISAASFAVGKDNLPYHTQCHQELHHPRCYVCQQFIPSAGNGSIEWRENPFWKLAHCPVHTSDGTAQCCSCNRLQAANDPEGVTLSDGRSLCGDCLGSVVVDTKDCQPLYDEVLAFYGYMGMPLPYKAPLLLVEGPVLNEYSAREGVGRGAGPVFHVRGLTLAEVYRSISSVVAAPRGSRGSLGSVSSVPFSLSGALSTLSGRTSPGGITERCSVTCILVLYGLPRLLMGSIIAHELLHAYLRMRHVTRLDDQIEEGLAQLMALLWLDAQEQEQAASPFAARLASYLGYQIRTDSSATYGDGFRIAYEKFQQRGLRALVEHVIATHQWPDWHA